MGLKSESHLLVTFGTNTCQSKLIAPVHATCYVGLLPSVVVLRVTVFMYCILDRS